MEKIFDSHSHYNDDVFIEDEKEVLQRIQREGVGWVLNCGYDLKSSKKALAQAQENDFIYCSAGYHPQDANRLTQENFDGIKELLQAPKNVALGEIGLDYHYEDAPDKETQKAAFVRQLELAQSLGKPVIIHTREAMEDTLNILKPFAHKLQGVIHCYSGSADSCTELVKMGFYIGFTGVITFKNARRAIEALKVVPKNRLLLETDCPYMSPEPFRGKRCDSSLLHYTAQKMGEELGLSKDEVIKLTRENAMELFRINP